MIGYKGFHAQCALAAPDTVQARLHGHTGSIAISGEGKLWPSSDGAKGQLDEVFRLQDVCGIGPGPEGFVFTSGTGIVGELSSNPHGSAYLDYQWGNHLIPIQTPAKTRQIPPHRLHLEESNCCRIGGR
ncbi:DUF1513 domain-containing protein [Ruegeria atlantica]|uniref:DUF1513 domain-containing protein n=1 Tax=Ruegeria atlantica TaxID=81569 RepID=UPI00147D5508